MSSTPVDRPDGGTHERSHEEWDRDVLLLRRLASLRAFRALTPAATTAAAILVHLSLVLLVLLVLVVLLHSIAWPLPATATTTTSTTRRRARSARPRIGARISAVTAADELVVGVRLIEIRVVLHVLLLITASAALRGTF